MEDRAGERDSRPFGRSVGRECEGGRAVILVLQGGTPFSSSTRRHSIFFKWNNSNVEIHFNWVHDSAVQENARYSLSIPFLAGPSAEWGYHFSDYGCHLRGKRERRQHLLGLWASPAPRGFPSFHSPSCQIWQKSAQISPHSLSLLFFQVKCSSWTGSSTAPS